MKFVRYIIFSALALLIFTAGVYAKGSGEWNIRTVEESGLEEILPVDPSIRIGVLDNGLKYYIKQNTKPADRMVLRLAVNAGSILEDEDQLGLAHFAEHMAFNV